MTHMPYDTAGLPDPDRSPEFYAETTAKRFFAWVIDSVIILGVTVLAIPFTAFTGIFFFPLLWTVIGLLYRIGTLSAYSATPGMALMAIELRRMDGTRFDLGTAALHTLVFTLAFTSFIAQLVSIILMLGSARGQGLPDMLLGTAAINRPARH